jgi:hypothetical protein
MFDHHSRPGDSVMSAIDFFKSVADALQDRVEHPYGIPAAPEMQKLAGEALVKFCGGDHDQARSLWKLIVADLGYMPHAVAFALTRASQTANLVPDVEAPVPS